ncbi:hypothetical protein SSX86_031267 [Deinandra increscens subsp. villosa]|uniref:Uncharacterized protein n=1 Tax=Deinandra increscens subsp. villosa TaxID=3103831 RepID=A0AAP0C577_9ASTR
MEKECQVDVPSVLNDSANPGCATVESFNMKTVVDISESETEYEVLGDGDGYESVTNLRTKRKHDVFKHILTVRRSPRIAKNKAYKRFNNTVDNPICLDSPDMSDVLASGAKKESSSKMKIELEKKNDQHVRVTISDQKRKDDESAIVTSKAEKGESSSKRDSDTGKCKESDAGNTKSNQNHKIEEKRAKNGETPCKRKALMEQTKAKKNPKIFVPAVNEDPDDDFMDSRTVKSSPLPPTLKAYDGRRIIPRNTPRHIWSVIKGLTDEQKDVVRGMGFGAFLELKITQIPTALSYWLLNNYDVNTQSLVTQNGVVKIDEKLINSVLGVPIGTEEITSIEKTTERDPVAKEWQSQFGEGKTKITMSDTNLMMRNRKDAGRLFQLNFLVVLCTSVVRVMQSGTVNQCFLNAITPGKEALYARIMLKSEYVKSGHQHAIGWVDDTMLSNLDTVLATELFARNLAIGEALNIPREVEKNKKIRKVKSSKKKPVKGVVVEMIEVSNVNEVKSGVVDKGYDECAQEGVESDLNLENTDVVDRGKGEYMGNVGNEDTCGKCINDSLNGNEDKGLENLVVAKESLMGLAGMVNEGSVDECIHVADNTEMGSGDRDINLCDAVSLVNVEAKHLEDGETESAKEFVNEEEHLSVLIDEFKMDTQDVDYYRAQFQSQPSMNVDDDGNVIIPMVSQYGPTQDFMIEEYDDLVDSYREQDRLYFIKKCISDFQDCYIQVQNTLRLAETEFPNSDAIRQQKSEWGLMVKQLSSRFQTQGKSVVSGSTGMRGLDAMHKSGGMTPTEMESKVGDERFESKSGSGLQFGVVDLEEGALGDLTNTVSKCAGEGTVYEGCYGGC